MTIELALKILALILLGSGVVAFPECQRRWKAWRYFRGRRRVRANNKPNRSASDSLRWGNHWIPDAAATQHFLAVGTTGSGKSLIQRLLMKEPLQTIGGTRPNSRAVIFDAKNDIASFLRHIEVDCPVYSFNPFQVAEDRVISVAWDIASDITSPARAMNLAAGLIPREKGGNNQYFTDAARQVVTAVVESLIRHSPGVWTFPDLVTACLSQSHIQQLLARDSAGQQILHGFFGDDRTAYQVFTTVFSRINYFRPAAAIWQRTRNSLSVREWLASDSILLLGANATARQSLDAINEQIFRVMVEEIDVQVDSSDRRTWVWIDEARLAGPLLQSDMLPFLGVKGRSKGVSLVLAFQDIEGLREAAGTQVANELVAQMSHKALLRMESDLSAEWASKQLGQFETIEYFSSGRVGNESLSAQRVVRESVLASEFFGIPPACRENGLTGYFLSPSVGACRSTVGANTIQPIVVSTGSAIDSSRFSQHDSEQWLEGWTSKDYQRLSIGLKEIDKQNAPLRPKLTLKKRRGELDCSGHPI